MYLYPIAYACIWGVAPTWPCSRFLTAAAYAAFTSAGVRSSTQPGSSAPCSTGSSTCRWGGEAVSAESLDLLPQPSPVAPSTGTRDCVYEIGLGVRHTSSRLAGQQGDGVGIRIKGLDPASWTKPRQRFQWGYDQGSVGATLAL